MLFISNAFWFLAKDSTAVTIKIHTETDFFESRATVVYSEPVSGLGLAFREIKPHFIGVLQTWLRSAMAGSSRLE